MNIIKYKKLIVMTLIFVMFMALLQQPLLTAKERRGSTVEVILINGSMVKGELLAVRDDALLLYEGDSGRGWHIYLQYVAQVRVLKKSKFLEGMAMGIVIGLVISVNNLKKIDHESLMPMFDIAGSFLPLPIAGFCGGLLGAFSGIPEKFHLDGESSQNMKENLERLKRYARERDFEKPAAN